MDIVVLLASLVSLTSTRPAWVATVTHWESQQADDSRHPRL